MHSAPSPPCPPAAQPAASRLPALGLQEQLQLSLELFGQRFVCAPVPASAEPAFAGEAFLELPVATATAALSKAGSGASVPPAAPGTPVIADPLQLLALRQGLHCVVAQLEPMAGAADADGDAAGAVGRGGGGVTLMGLDGLPCACLDSYACLVSSEASASLLP
jgi:hypothetical protein